MHKCLGGQARPEAHTALKGLLNQRTPDGCISIGVMTQHVQQRLQHRTIRWAVGHSHLHASKKQAPALGIMSPGEHLRKI